MDEKTILNNLRSKGLIKPRNKNFFTNLQKSLVNERSAQIEKKPHTGFKINMRIMMPALSLLGLVVFVSLIVINNENFVSQINPTQFNNDVAISPKEAASIDGNKVFVNNINLDNFYMNVKLPEEFTLDQSVIASETNGFLTSYKSTDSQVIFDYSLESIYNEAEKTNPILTENSFKIYEINKTKYSKISNITLDKDAKKYILSPERKSYIVISTSQNTNDLIKFIAQNISVTDPYEKWLQYADYKLGVKLNYPENWKNTSTGIKSETDSKSIEITVTKIDSTNKSEAEIFLRNNIANIINTNTTEKITTVFNYPKFAVSIRVDFKGFDCINLTTCDNTEEVKLLDSKNKEVKLILSSIESFDTSKFRTFKTSSGIKFNYSKDHKVESGKSKEEGILDHTKIISGENTLEILVTEDKDYFEKRTGELKDKTDAELLISNNKFIGFKSGNSDGVLSIYYFANNDKNYVIIINISTEEDSEVFNDILNSIVI